MHFILFLVIRLSYSRAKNVSDPMMLAQDKAKNVNDSIDKSESVGCCWTVEN